MKPVRVFSHATSEPPGHIITLLDRLEYPYEMVCLEDGRHVPMELDNISALVFMGGPGNVNEPPDWMKQEMTLIQHAIEKEIPVLGICLGAQLMSKALGGKIWQADSVEVGWHDVQLLSAAKDSPCFVDLPENFTVFQWHAHVFSAPSGAVALATSECTECQAYSYGKSLALQFHLEMTEKIITELTDKFSSDLVGESDCVQNRDEILNNIKANCEQTFAIADILLTPWFLLLNK